MKSYTSKLTTSAKGLLTLTAAAGVLALTAPQARAGVVFNETQTFSAVTFNQCNGDIVSVDGTVHEVDQVTDNGKTVHLGQHLNFNVSGVGLPSGAIYSNANEQVNFELNIAKGTTLTQVVNFRLIAQGQTPNVVLHALQHITVDANGNVTSSIDNFTVDCH
jgi:hypothetical protein